MKNPKVFHQKDARNGELGVRSGCGSSFSKTGFWGTWKWSEGKQIKEDLDRTAHIRESLNACRLEQELLLVRSFFLFFFFFKNPSAQNTKVELYTIYIINASSTFFKFQNLFHCLNSTVQYNLLSL